MVRRQGLSRDSARKIHELVTGRELPDHILSSDFAGDCQDMPSMCVPWRCPIYVDSSKFGGPSFDAFLSANRDSLEKELIRFLDTNNATNRIRIVQVPVSGGKTYQLANTALELLRRGDPFYVLVDNHDTGENFFKELRRFTSDGRVGFPDGRRVAFMLGRSSGLCSELLGLSQRCRNCNNWRKINLVPMQDGAYRRRNYQIQGGIYGKKEILSMRSNACPHAISTILAGGADGVVMVQNYILDPSLRGRIPRLRPCREGKTPYLLWDEADTMIDGLTTRSALSKPLLKSGIGFRTDVITVYDVLDIEDAL